MKLHTSHTMNSRIRRGWRLFPIQIMTLIMLITVPGTSFAAGPVDRTPLVNRLVSEDGDRKNVLLWQWLNDLTGDNAAVVLTQAGDLAKVSLPRMWRKGQTIGQVVRGAELFLGDFKVHFSQRTLTLISMTASEKMNNEDYRKTVFASGWGEGLVFSVEAWGGLMQPATVAAEADPFTSFGAGLALGFMPGLEATLRFESGSGEMVADGKRLEATKLNLLAGLRWRPFADWFVSPYLAGSALFSVYSEKLIVGGQEKSWSGAGFVAAAGLAVGPVAGFSLMIEYGRSWTFIPSNTLEFGELRAGVSLAL